MKLFFKSWSEASLRPQQETDWNREASPSDGSCWESECNPTSQSSHQIFIKLLSQRLGLSRKHTQLQHQHYDLITSPLNWLLSLFNWIWCSITNDATIMITIKLYWYSTLKSKRVHPLESKQSLVVGTYHSGLNSPVQPTLSMISATVWLKGNVLGGFEVFISFCMNPNIQI